MAPEVSLRIGTYRRLVTGSHLVLYQIAQDTVVVNRILHKRLDIDIALSE